MNGEEKKKKKKRKKEKKKRSIYLFWDFNISVVRIRNVGTRVVCIGIPCVVTRIAKALKGRKKISEEKKNETKLK